MRLPIKKQFIVIFACFLLFTLVIWGCAPKAAGSSGTGGGSVAEDPDDAEDQYAEDFTWSPEANCVVCHKKEGNLSLETGSATHITEQGNRCVDCHDPAEISGLHAGKTSASKTPIRLMKTDIYEDTCLTSGCHVKSELAGKTAASVVLTDKEGNVANPHDYPSNKFHDSPYNVTCIKCHTMHVETTIQESAYAFCAGECHHDEVFKCQDYCHVQRM
ncbi:MAG: hypothetical protein FWF91_00120 [Coriobacteriia bacterium]|nr:hypothetical protein [Coriobacteriia bacterium]